MASCGLVDVYRRYGETRSELYLENMNNITRLHGITLQKKIIIDTTFTASNFPVTIVCNWVTCENEALLILLLFSSVCKKFPAEFQR
jgi:hypothetical protein